ncbi:hypothetical protein E1202_15090 [Saccharopolyspora karakumensis]|uniref:Polyketide cyclase / dehydrase and lipid transport n=1 Tax=Saccharopolyspora karakumensis TaxID=2530386 RepID=A0A4R5BS64_9PSEU|nr:hypothetical protein [Saccharopolyspora karakumensis]TDD88110.1 hypothetical protein E1202_15090 [Saccharopolyspora karakumensis]
MPFYSTMAETDIECPAMDVYSYITDPANWEDGRPVTDPGWTLVPRGRQPAGTTWREPRGEDWAILEAEPGRRWIVRSQGVDDASSVTITYSFSEVEGMTHVFRHMEIEVSAHAAISEHARAAFTCSKPGRDVVTVIKRVLEGSRQVVAPPVAVPVSISQPD